jgi:Tfp pilus assembly protein FimT
VKKVEQGRQMKARIIKNDKGYSLVNMLATLAMIGILLATATSNLKIISNPLADASFALNHYFRLSRARAISQTTVIKIAPTSTTRVVATSGETCDTATAAVDNLAINLPTGARLVTTDWSTCFTARGLATEAITFSLIDDRGVTRTVEIALGGGSRIQ